MTCLKYAHTTTVFWNRTQFNLVRLNNVLHVFNKNGLANPMRFDMHGIFHRTCMFTSLVSLPLQAFPVSSCRIRKVYNRTWQHTCGHGAIFNMFQSQPMLYIQMAHNLHHQPVNTYNAAMHTNLKTNYPHYKKSIFGKTQPKTRKFSLNRRAWISTCHFHVQLIPCFSCG